jgi:hypothetical protein
MTFESITLPNLHFAQMAWFKRVGKTKGERTALGAHRVAKLGLFRWSVSGQSGHVVFLIPAHPLGDPPVAKMTVS